MDKEHYGNIMDIETTAINESNNREKPEDVDESENEEALPNSKRRKIVIDNSEKKSGTNDENNIQSQIDPKTEVIKEESTATTHEVKVSDIREEFNDKITIKEEFSNNLEQNFNEHVQSKSTNFIENQILTDVRNPICSKNLNSETQKTIKSDPDMAADLQITYVKKENLEKTQVKLLIIKDNGDQEIFKIKIQKPSNNITLVDVKQHLMSQPRKYNNFDIEKYEYQVKTTEDGIPSWEDCDEDDGMLFLPLFEDLIIIKCCFKS